MVVTSRGARGDARAARMACVAVGPRVSVCARADEHAVRNGVVPISTDACCDSHVAATAAPKGQLVLVWVARRLSDLAQTFAPMVTYPPVTADPEYAKWARAASGAAHLPLEAPLNNRSMARGTEVPLK